MLAPHNTSNPIWFGCKYVTLDTPHNGFLHGGAGYVMSRGALEKLVLQVRLVIKVGKALNM
jgi:hypothetical protein